MSANQRRRSSAFLKPYDPHGGGCTKHSLSLEIVINRDKMSPDRKVRSFDFELSFCREPEDGGPPICQTKHFAKVDLDRDSDSSPSVVRYNDMGSLEEVCERQQMLDELVDVDYGQRVVAPTPSVGASSIGMDAISGAASSVTPSAATTLPTASTASTGEETRRERYLAVDVWHLRASIAGEESMASQGQMREERRKSAAASIKAASIDATVGTSAPSSMLCRSTQGLYSSGGLPVSQRSSSNFLQVRRDGFSEIGLRTLLKIAAN